MADCTIRAIPNGPYRLTGPARITDPQGNETVIEEGAVGLALPLRRLGEQAVLRRHAQPHRIPGGRSGGDEERARSRASRCPGIAHPRSAVAPRRSSSPPAPAPAAASVAGDFDGDGVSEQAAAAVRREAVRLEIRSASGRVLAPADAPAPRGRRRSGRRSLDLPAGSLGSAGAPSRGRRLVGAATSAARCGAIREGALSRVPLVAARRSTPDCGPAAGWT